MKKILVFFASLMLVFSVPGWALEMLSTQSMEAPRTYKIEVLQVTDIGPYREALNGFLKTLRDNGIKEGENLIVNRVIIDFDVENGGFWDRLSLLGRIRDEANRVASAKPDLALTIGTPATKYARRILELSKIPTVFTAVANPLDAGATSMSDAGTGATGSTLHIDMANSMKMLKQIFPSVTRIGMVHTDDENGVTHVQAARDRRVRRRRFLVVVRRPGEPGDFDGKEAAVVAVGIRRVVGEEVQETRFADLDFAALRGGNQAALVVNARDAADGAFNEPGE